MGQCKPFSGTKNRIRQSFYDIQTRSEYLMFIIEVTYEIYKYHPIINVIIDYRLLLKITDLVQTELDTFYYTYFRP